MVGETLRYEPRFWIERNPKFSGGCTTLFFHKDWKQDSLSFNDEELEDLRRVLGVGEVISCDMKRLEEKVDILYKMVHNHEKTIIESPLYDLCKRVRALEECVPRHARQNVAIHDHLESRIDKLDVQLDNFSKLVVDWMKTTGGDVETLKEEFGLMKFIECYARGRKTLDDLQNGKDATE